MIKLKDILNEKNKGLWHNIHAKRKRGEKPAKPGDEDYPKTLDIDEDDDDPCWDNYKQVGMKTKNGKKVPNCVPESYDVWDESCGYTIELDRYKDGKMNEAEYQGRKVKLNKPMQGDGNSKFKVYVKDGDSVKKVSFGAKGSENRIKKNNPERRKSFRARHNCDNPGPKTKARYWSCKKW